MTAAWLGVTSLLILAAPAADYIFATRIVGPDRGRPRGQGPDGLHAREISRGMLGALPSR